MNCKRCDKDITEMGKKFKYCKDCAKLKLKESYVRYREKETSKVIRMEYGKKHYESNKDKLKPIRKRWRENNKEKEQMKNRDRYLEKDKIRLSNYYVENKELINDRKREYRKTEEYKKWKVEYDSKNAYKQRYRDSLKSVIRRLNLNKNDYTNKLLGYSDIDFKLHIENQFTNEMSWENRDSFEIDHIIPIISFIKNTPLNIVSSLDNLMPINPTENIKKFISIDYNYIKLYEKYIDYLIPEYKQNIIDYLYQLEE